MPTLDELLRAAFASRLLRLERDQHLFRREDLVERFYVVESGRLRLVRHLADGRTLVLHRARAGETFAEGSLATDRYHCDGIADVASRVRVYRKADVLTGLGTEAHLAVGFLHRLATELTSARALLELRGIRHARVRLISFFELIARGGVVELDRPIKEMAAEIGLSAEVMYRTLATLEREGLITRKKGAIALRAKRPRAT